MRFIFNLCDRVLCLVRGKTLIEGTPKEVQSDPRVIEAYIGTGEGTDDPDPADDGGLPRADDAPAFEATTPKGPDAHDDEEGR